MKTGANMAVCDCKTISSVCVCVCVCVCVLGVGNVYIRLRSWTCSTCCRLCLSTWTNTSGVFVGSELIPEQSWHRFFLLWIAEPGSCVTSRILFCCCVTFSTRWARGRRAAAADSEGSSGWKTSPISSRKTSRCPIQERGSTKINGFVETLRWIQLRRFGPKRVSLELDEHLKSHLTFRLCFFQNLNTYNKCISEWELIAIYKYIQICKKQNPQNYRPVEKQDFWPTLWIRA